MRTKPDFYEVLRVDRTATQDEIKKAYKKLARQYHPDVNSDPDAEERFKEVTEAYSVLGDPERRQRYDRYGLDGLQSNYSGDFGFGADLEDLIATFFGGGRARTDVERGSDLRYDIELSLQEVLTGAERSIEVTKHEYCDTCEGTGAVAGHGQTTCSQCGGHGRLRRSQATLLGHFTTTVTCPNCGGSGRVIAHPCATCRGEGRTQQPVKLTVSVPAGVDTGDRIRLRGQGQAGRRGGPPGDLYVYVRVREHERFERRGTELATEVPITFSQAALGGTIEVEGIDGETLRIDIPAGTQTGARFELRGKGLPTTQSSRRGGLHVFVRVDTPTDLSDEERELFRRLAELRHESRDTGSSRGFFRKVWDHLLGE